MHKAKATLAGLLELEQEGLGFPTMCWATLAAPPGFLELDYA